MAKTSRPKKTSGKKVVQKRPSVPASPERRTAKARPAAKSQTTRTAHPAPERRTPKLTRQARTTAPGTAASTDLSTEQRIMAAAKKLFTLHGFAAVRTRDIAKEAGINLALLNYYFRSKEKLFDLVMIDNFRQFIKGISINIFAEEISLQEKISRFTSAYIDFLIHNPDLPMFIINEIRKEPGRMAHAMNEDVAPMRSRFFRELQEAARQGSIADLPVFHVVANIIGLTVFPFVARPLLQRVTGVSDQQFFDYMEARKELVPMWINAIMHARK